MTSANATIIRDRLAASLAQDVEVADLDGRVVVLTPAEYPDGEAIAVWVTEREAGKFEITDLGSADARLTVGGPGRRAITQPASTICRRLDLSFEDGAVVGRSGLEDLSATCWRVAQAASAIAEAATYQQTSSPKATALVTMLESEFRTRSVQIQVDAVLRGASGHTYTASLFVPDREAVLEPIGAEKAWNKAAAVYVEFGDLGAANGYKLVSVLDDRDEAVGEDVEQLLGQVGVVARWSRRGEWIEELARGRML
jgi:hypothetical protein